MEKVEKPEQEIYSKLARLCSHSEQCSPDLRKKIREMGGTSAMADRIIEQLEKEKFLSDERYARAYVSEKFRINKWGRIKMEYYLRMKGLKDSIIKSGFTEIDENQYIKLLMQIMKEKAKSITRGNKFDRMGQIIRFTQSRGFEPELIHRYLGEI
jgi:regulatory protein